MPSEAQTNQSPIIIAYVPVLHRGYKQFFDTYLNKNRDVGLPSAVYLLGPEFLEDFPYLKKEIRSLSPELTQQTLELWYPKIPIKILDKKSLQQIAENKIPVIAPREDVLEWLVEQYLPENILAFDSIFLRWDRKNTTKESVVAADKAVPLNQVQQKFMDTALAEAEKSSDWWRQVGAVIIGSDGKIIASAHNTHVPSEHQPYLDSDARNAFHTGVNIELGNSIHAEAKAVAQAARAGTALEGAEMYATTFPCPVCAKLIAACGIKKLYFAQGYSMLDGERVLKTSGVEIVRTQQE